MAAGFTPFLVLRDGSGRIVQTFNPAYLVGVDVNYRGGRRVRSVELVFSLPVDGERRYVLADDPEAGDHATQALRWLEELDNRARRGVSWVRLEGNADRPISTYLNTGDLSRVDILEGENNAILQADVIWKDGTIQVVDSRAAIALVDHLADHVG